MAEQSVSVVIPTFNRAEFIGETIESVISQSREPEEVIVVDDGSTDDTEAVVRGFKGNVLYIRTENQGVCAARNLGVKSSTGNVIAFCDSDDVWLPTKLDVQMSLHRRFGVDYSFTNFLLLENSQVRGKKFDSVPKSFLPMAKRVEEAMLVTTHPIYEVLLKSQPIFPSTLVMSRGFFERVGRFKAELGRTAAEDLEFTLRCSQHHPLGIIEQPLVKIRKHAGNFSGNLFRTLCGEIQILQYALEQHDLAESARQAINRAIDARRVDAGERAFEHGDLESCVRYLAPVWPGLSMAGKVKYLISRLPYPLRDVACRYSRKLGQARRAA
jgi:glycosyltransferase involved in cell wall biosynthesis